MNILILGGTGAMGMHLVRFLAQRGDKVSVTSRSKYKSIGNIEFIHGDAKDDSFLKPLLASKWDAIVDFMVYSTPVFNQRASDFLAATKQYIFLSSARVYANSEVIIHEDSLRLLDSSNDEEFLDTDEYSLAKARQENILKKSGRNNWTIIRPYITYSEKRLQLGVLEKEEWLYRALKGRTIVFSEDIATKLTTLTYGLDVALAICRTIGEPYSLGETYQIAQNKTLRWQDVLEIYLDVIEKYIGTRPEVLLLSLRDFTACKQAEYQIKYDRLFDREFDNSKISRIVDVDDFMLTKDGLTHCLQDFLKNPEFLHIDWRSEAIKDRHTGEVASFAEMYNWKQKLKYFFYRFIKPYSPFMVES